MVAEPADLRSLAGRDTPLVDRMALRALVRTFYDFQRIRIMLGNRICQQFRVQLGQDPGKSSAELSTEAKKLLKDLRLEYRRLADALSLADRRRWQNLLDESRGIIHTPEQLVMVKQYLGMEENEERLGREIAAMVQDFPIWKHFLRGIKGCGPLMSAVLITELNPELSRHVAQYWKIAGVDLGPDGAGRSKRAEHLIDRTYVARDGTTKTRKSITYNPFLKTKLLGVLAASFLIFGGKYREDYVSYKHRIENSEKYGIQTDTTKMHRHRMAIRHMMKLFLADLWKAGRQLQGLPVGLSYAEQYLGRHHATDALEPDPIVYGPLDGTATNLADLSDEELVEQSRGGEPLGQGDLLDAMYDLEETYADDPDAATDTAAGA
jgi:hypothetical protein